ncbi:MAG: TlpA family protein disulfide reductase [Verrucomicrobiae bacterium]|nr:TlpA family protein disulfide reductase [Verrucomicrobiae bacterium]
MPKAGDKPPKISLSQWVGEPADWKGKVLLMEFWATWCPPCRKSIPHLNEIWEKYKDQGLMVVGVSNESAQTIKSFQHEIPMKYPVAISTSLARDYGVEGIPQAFIIGRDGKVLWAGHPMELNDSIVENALKESAPAPAGSAPSDAK